ncbi:glycosyltransferase [Mucilaginibacter lutimaris]|uniref:Glycosyltransferase n=1 Tax=Mucilaginibacter lutimaris TaxID=931629 RepID=A0ABW2ZGZ7_9SPHI
MLKEALALSKAGHSITIFTAIYSHDLYQEDLSLLAGTGICYEIYSDLRVQNFAAVKARLSRKFWQFTKCIGVESKYSLGYNASRLKKRILSRPAHLYIMHQELATVIGSRMVKKYKVVFDIEDWYSEDLLPIARKNRPIKLLKRSEKTAIEKGAACYTTSYAMAKGLQALYKTTNSPSVIYNSFVANEQVDFSPQHDFLHLYWISQTIGEGRGLEFFIYCMGQSTTKCKLSLRGNVLEAYKISLNALLSPKDSIDFLPMLKNEEIQTDMARYDVGLALEPDSPLNKDLTISNKLFHYMAAGLPVIASDTKGQSEIAKQCPDLVMIYQQSQAGELTGILNRLGEQLPNGQLNGLKTRVLDFYTANFAWPGQAGKLTALIHSIFESES